MQPLCRNGTEGEVERLHLSHDQLVFLQRPRYLLANAAWIVAMAWAGVAVPARMVWTESFTVPPAAGDRNWSR